MNRLRYFDYYYVVTDRLFSLEIDFEDKSYRLDEVDVGNSSEDDYVYDMSKGSIHMFESMLGIRLRRDRRRKAI